ncbi:MAG TPA: DR2241 family protein [Tepidiformaceae bacterium]|nr:DR2241 family protein [Tepidiformaceae bacterium]
MSRLGELWIREDRGTTLVGVGEPLQEVVATFAAVRAHVRHDTLGRYRPLSGARGLPENWFVRGGPGLSTDEVIEAVYPLATVHRRQWSEGTLRVVGLDAVLERQTGRYEVAARLSAGGRAGLSRVLCADVCVREPVWNGAACDEQAIPCPEPCSVLVSLAREAALWEESRPNSHEFDPGVEFAAFDTPGNALREATLRLMAERGANE